MKKNLIIFLLILSAGGFAQEKGIGIRGGFQQGITGKLFIEDKIAIEGIIATRWNGVGITGLYEVHQQAFDVSGLRWFYGAGAHIGYYRRVFSVFGEIPPHYMAIGVDGIIGIEYLIPNIPIGISLDWKPAVNIIGDFAFWGDQGALSARYYF